MSASFIEVVAHDGGRFNAYVARPAQGSGSGLVLLQEIFGINDYMKSMADRFAEEGYVVLVPDLFWRVKPGVVLGYGEADMKEALGYLQRFDIDRAVDDIAATIGASRALPEQAGKVARIASSMNSSSVVLIPARSTGCCRASRPPESISKCRCWPSCAFAATSYTTSISIGTRHRCWCRSARSIRQGCRSRAFRPRRKWSMKPCRRTR
jgi:Dienelactone hydrolase family